MQIHIDTQAFEPIGVSFTKMSILILVKTLVKEIISKCHSTVKITDGIFWANNFR